MSSSNKCPILKAIWYVICIKIIYDRIIRGLMKKLKLKIIVKMRKMDSFKDNNDVDY